MLSLPIKELDYDNIISISVFISYNLVDLAGSNFPSAYDKFLLAVSMAANVMTVWNAWKWV